MRAHIDVFARPPFRVLSAICVAAALAVSCSSTSENKTDAPVSGKARFYETLNAQRFYKGALHVHTTESDGDVSPAKAAEWYQKHGFSFVSITDHNLLTPHPKIAADNFIFLNGVEITGVAANKTPVHLNAICGNLAVTGLRKEVPVKQLLAEQIALSRADGAITMVNHPNFGWAITREDLLAVDDFEILEIASGHPLVHDIGDGTHSSAEELWDAFLSKKHRLYSAAVDDSHDFKKFGDAERNPGRAWIQAWAPELSQTSICDAIRQGHFYSSRGTKISALVVEPRHIELKIEYWQPATDHVDFIGVGGQLLDRSTANPARYTLKGGEGYVRAHVYQGVNPDDAQKAKREAWTQAYFIRYD